MSSLQNTRRPSPVHSARSSLSSHSGRSGTLLGSRPKKKSLTSMSGMPSVQQLAAIDKAVSSGPRHSLVLEPDLIAALHQRIRPEDIKIGGDGSPKIVTSERRASFAGSHHGFKEGTGSNHSGHHSKESSQRAYSSSWNPGDAKKTRTSSIDSDKSHKGTRSNSKVDIVSWGQAGQAFPGMPMSAEASYRLIPTETAEETDKEEPKKPSKKSFRNSRKDSQKDLPAWRIKGQEALQSICFQTFMAVLIISNALVIGLETDITTYKHWDMIENGFLFCFLGELLIKATFQGVCDLFDRENPDFNWNIFDTFIVTLGVIDFTVGLLTTAKSGGIGNMFRIIRLLRILRIIRIVKFLKQLYLLAFGLAEAAQAVFWVTILMTFILYVCSIIMVKTIGRPPDTDPNQDFLEKHFGAVLPSMLSLFVLMSSPNLPIYQDQEGLLESRPLLALFLVGFIVFGSFGMVALLTGVISESMFEKNDMRKEEERIEHEKLRLDVGLRCEELYERFEKNDEDEVNIEEVNDEVMVEEMAKTFEAVGVFVTTYDLRTMIEYLDVDGSGTINKDEFLRGMLVLAEGLRPITVQEVHHDVGVCRVKIERIEESVATMNLLLRGEAGNVAGRKAPPPSVAASTDASFTDGGENSTHNVLENLTEQIQDLTKQQKQMFKQLGNNFQDLDGKIREVSTKVVQSPLGEDMASLKAYLSTSLQEIGQHIIQQTVQQISKERSYPSSRWNDAKFGVPLEVRSQASYALSTTREPSPRAGQDSTWPSLSFSAAGSSVEQAGGGTSSATTGVDHQKFFTFSLDQLESPARHQAEEVCSRTEVADVVMEAARHPFRTTASTTATTAASTSAMVPSLNHAPRAEDAMNNLPEASISRAASRSVDMSVDLQSSLASSQVQELISWQQRIESELRRVSQLAQQEGAAQATQVTQPAPAQSTAQSAPAAAPAAQPPQVPQLPLSPSAQQAETAQPVQTQAEQALKALQIAKAAQPPSSSADSASNAEPARHPTAMETANAASLAELLNQMRELVSNHEALQKMTVGASTGRDTSRSSEVLDCESCPSPSHDRPL